MARDGCPDRILMAIEMIADGSPNKVGSVRVKTFLHKEIDLTQIYVTQVDRDFLAVASFSSKLTYIIGH